MAEEHSNVKAANGNLLNIVVMHNALSTDFAISHRHPGVELHYCMDGSGFCEIAGTRVPIHPGRVTLLWAPMTHKVVATESPYRRSVIHFASKDCLCGLVASDAEIGSLLPAPSQPILQFLLSEDDRHTFDNTFCELARKYLNTPDLIDGSILPNIMRLFLALARSPLLHIHQMPPPTPYEEFLARRIEDLVHHTKNASITATEIAQQLQLNPGHVRRVYRSARGINLRDLLNSHRFHIACRLLQKGVNITDVAFSCQFEDASNFSRFFKRYIGMSPRQYQQWVMGKRKAQGRSN